MKYLFLILLISGCSSIPPINIVKTHQMTIEEFPEKYQEMLKYCSEHSDEEYDHCPI